MTSVAPDLLICHATQLVTVEAALGDPLGVIEDGAVAVRAGRISWVGPTSRLPVAEQPGASTRVIDATGRVLLPGLVDCHTHVVYGGDRAADFELRLSGLTYAEIAARGGGILTTVAHTRAATLDSLVANAQQRLQSMLRYGVTTVEIKSGYGLELASEVKILAAIRALGEHQAIRVVPTFLGAHTVPAEFRGEQERYVSLLIEEMIPAVAEAGLARFCDVYVEEGVAFSAAQARRILTAARRHSMLPKLHVDQLKAGAGAELAAELGAVSADHLEFTSPAGMTALRDARVVAVLLPGASLFLGGAHHAPGRALVDAGVEIAIATDCNPGTSPTDALPLCGTIACTSMGLRPAEAVRAMTLGAARALSLEDEIGSIKAGKQADLVLFDTPDWRHLVYRFGSPLAHLVVRGGAVVHPVCAPD